MQPWDLVRIDGTGPYAGTGGVVVHFSEATPEARDDDGNVTVPELPASALVLVDLDGSTQMVPAAELTVLGHV